MQIEDRIPGTARVGCTFRTGSREQLGQVANLGQDPWNCEGTARAGCKFSERIPGTQIAREGCKFSLMLSKSRDNSCNMPGSLGLLHPGQQNRFQGNHVVVGQGEGFEPRIQFKLKLKNCNFS